MFEHKNKIIVLLLLVLVYLVNEKCSSEKYKDRVEQNLNAQNDTIRNYQLKNGQQVSSIKTLQVSNDELKKQVWFKDDSLDVLLAKFNKVSAAVKIKTVVQIDCIFVPYEVNKKNELSRIFKIENESLKLKGSVQENGVVLEEIKIPNIQRIVIGQKKKYFKTLIYTEVTNTNKYLKTESINSQVTTVKNKRFGIGVFGGYDIAFRPTIGIGVSYNFIQF